MADPAVARMIAAEHLALTALNMMLHWRAAAFGANPVVEADAIAEGLIATFLDTRIDDPELKAMAVQSLRRDGDALRTAAARLAQALGNTG